jgi:hypothetical protein
MGSLLDHPRLSGNQDTKRIGRLSLTDDGLPEDEGHWDKAVDHQFLDLGWQEPQDR